MNSSDRRRRWSRDWRNFRIYTPPDGGQGPAALHQFLLQLWSRTLSGGWSRFWYGQPWLTFEIRATPTEVQHVWAAPRKVAAFLEQELAAYRPGEPEPIELDPLPVGKHTAGTVLRLQKPPCFGLADRQIARDLLDAFKGLQPGETALLQLLLIPLRDGPWRKEAHKEFRKAAQLNADGSETWEQFNDIWADVFGKVSDLMGLPRNTMKKDRADPIERAQLKDAPQNLQDHAFEVVARVVTTAPTSARAGSLVQNIKAQFASLDKGNRVIPQRVWLPGRLRRLAAERWPTGEGSTWTCGELAQVVGAPGSRTDPKDGPVLELRVPPPESGIQIGYAQYRGARVPMRMPLIGLFEHLLIAGRTGKGKGVDQLAICMDLAKQGLGFTWLFPLRRDAYSLMAALPEECLPNVIFAEVGHPRYALPLNILANDGTPDDQERAGREALNLFARLFADGWGPRSELLFRLSLAAAAAVGGHVGDAERVLMDTKYAAQCAANIANPNTRRSLAAEVDQKEWGKEVDAPLNKYSTLTMATEVADMLCQPDTLNWRDIVLGKKIVIVSLNQEQLGDLGARTAAGAIVNALLRAVKSIPHDKRADVSHILGLDEFKIVTGEKTQDFWEEGFSQARQFKLGIVPAIQYPDQIPGKTWAGMSENIGSAIIMGQRDAATLKFLGKNVTAEDLARLPSLEAVANVQIEGSDRTGRKRLVETGPFSLFAPPFLEPVRDGFQAAEESMARWLRPRKPAEPARKEGAPQALEVE